MMGGRTVSVSGIYDLPLSPDCDSCARKHVEFYDSALCTLYHLPSRVNEDALLASWSVTFGLTEATASATTSPSLSDVQPATTLGCKGSLGVLHNSRQGKVLAPSGGVRSGAACRLDWRWEKFLYVDRVALTKVPIVLRRGYRDAGCRYKVL